MITVVITFASKRARISYDNCSNNVCIQAGQDKL